MDDREPPRANKGGLSGLCRPKPKANGALGEPFGSFPGGNMRTRSAPYKQMATRPGRRFVTGPPDPATVDNWPRQHPDLIP
jgi:hypothetical protein